MKILFFDHVPVFSGGERSLFDVMLCLKERGWEMGLLLPRWGDLAEEAKKIGVEVRLISIPDFILRIKREEIGLYPRVLSSLSPIAKELRKAMKGYDILYTNSQKAHCLSVLVPEFPIIWHFRDILYGRARILMNMLSVVPRRIIAISQAVRRQFWLSAKVRIVYNAVELAGGYGENHKFRVIYDAVEPEATEKIEIIKGKKIGMVGQIAPWKGQHNFIEVMAKVLKKRKDVYGVVIGDVVFDKPENRKYKEMLLKRVKELGIDDRIIFTGYIKNPYPAMSSLDVLVHVPEEEEPFGRVLVEAMALKVPVVSHDIGGIKEVVGDAGFVLPYKDFDGMSEKILEIIENPSLREKLVEKGRKRWEENFRLKRLITQIEGVIKSI